MPEWMKLALVAIAAGAVAVCGQPAAMAAHAGIGAIEKERLIVTSRYYIGPEDVLDVMVWRNKDLSKVVTVRPDGRISLPLVGDVAASGRTPTEVTEEIKRRLSTFLESPTVSLAVKEVNSYSIFVLGEIAKPGRYKLKSKTTLLQAITLAGGFVKTADRSRIVVLHTPRDAPEKKFVANYTDIVMRDGLGQNLIMKPGDTVIVPSEMMVMAE